MPAYIASYFNVASNTASYTLNLFASLDLFLEKHLCSHIKCWTFFRIYVSECKSGVAISHLNTWFRYRRTELQTSPRRS